jgi:site-specific recombinase XerC
MNEDRVALQKLVTTIGEKCRMCYTCVRECPAKAIRIPKPKRGEPKAISTQDFSSLLQAVQGDTVNERRNRAMLLLLADSAARVGGLVRIRLADLDLEQRTVYLVEKGEKGRYAFFSPLTGEAIKAWLAARRRCARSRQRRGG